MIAQGARPVALCADDFGIGAPVSEAILQLLAAGRLSATSVMTTMPGWADRVTDLAAWRHAADIGLHLDLTQGAPAGSMPRFAPGGRFPSLGRVVRAALAGAIEQAEVAGEIHRQLDRFEARAGGPPDHVDGHQHVHALPVVRDALVAVLTARGLAPRVWVRDPADRLASIARRRLAAGKAAFVSWLGRGFGAALGRAGIAANAGFSGFSGFAADGDYGAEMTRAVLAPGPRPLIMCHPGLPWAEDDLASRPAELRFLAGDAFPALLRAAGLRLERMSRMVTAPAAASPSAE